MPPVWLYEPPRLIEFPLPDRLPTNVPLWMFMLPPMVIANAAVVPPCNVPLPVLATVKSPFTVVRPPPMLIVAL